MAWSKPSIPQVWQAIEAYLKFAYAGAAPPSAVRDRLASLRATGEADFWDSPVLERGEDARSPARHALRLGNKVYPHMKLVIDRSPDGRAFLFRVDTHDKHIQPRPGSREARAFGELMKMNQSFAEQIESDWTARGIATFKQYLRDDLARRAAATTADAPGESTGQSTASPSAAPPA